MWALTLQYRPQMNAKLLPLQSPIDRAGLTAYETTGAGIVAETTKGSASIEGSKSVLVLSLIITNAIEWLI